MKWFLLFSFTFLCRVLWAQPIDTLSQKRIYRTIRLHGQPPVIDGKLNDLAWDEGEWSGGYAQQLPNEGAAPSQPTYLKIVFDDKNVYVAIKAIDNDKKIDARRGNRDQFYGDIVGVCFDSYLDYRTGFEFDLSAGGAKIDLILLNNDIDMSWNPVWEGKTFVADSIWTAEMKIPLSQLRFSQKDEQVWGLHAWRWINRNFEESQWNLIPRNNAGTLYHIGELHGLNNIKPKKHIELLPYTAFQSKHMAADANNPFSDGNDQAYSIGIDGKVGISSNFTIDFTINPDFGQVEADPAELNLTVFETYFDEKRPFFLEGRNIFDFTGYDLFYSRRIGHQPSLSPDYDSDNGFADQPQNTTILGALKLTGKTENGLSIGFLNGLTQKENASVWENGQASSQTIEPLSNYMVARVQQDINKGNSMFGGMVTATNRQLNDISELTRNAYSGGVDFFHHWNDKNYFAKGSIVGSYTQGPKEAVTDLQERSSRYYQRPDANHLTYDTTATQLSGLASKFTIGKTQRKKWSYQTGYDYRTPGLELNDLGYLTTTDQLNWNSSVKYKITQPRAFFLEYAIELDVNNQWSTGGEHLESSQFLSFYMRLKNKWFVNAHSGRIERGVDTRLLRGGPSVNLQNYWCNNIYFESDGAKTVSLGGNYHFHVFDDRVSYNHNFNPWASVKIGKSLNVSAGLNLSDSRDMLFYVDGYDFDGSASYLLGEQTRQTMGMTLRADWAITPEITLQYYLNPYLSNGTMRNYKVINNPSAADYSELCDAIDPTNIDQNPDDSYSFVHKGNTYTFDEPGFTYQDLRSNFVFRWEYRAGSSVYFVWTHNRSGYESVPQSHIADGWEQLHSASPTNVWMIKLNYWFGL